MPLHVKFLSRSRTVQASELAARHDKVRVLNMSTIKELIKESVAEAMVDINTGMSSDRLAEEVEKRVDEQLAAFKAEKQDAQAQAKRLEEELENAQKPPSTASANAPSKPVALPCPKRAWSILSAASSAWSTRHP